MPTYEYSCKKCGVVEVEQRISEAPLTHCPECEKAGKSEPVERIISAAAFHLKGGGWYKSDYAKNSKQAAKEGQPAASETTGEKAESASNKSGEKDSLKTAPCGTGCGCHK